MDMNLYVILIPFLIINLASFLLMLFDKVRSTRPGAERISEGMMFFLAAIFGASGVYLGMFAFRHKTRKWYFLIGIPILIIQNVSLAYLIYLFLFARL